MKVTTIMNIEVSSICNNKCPYCPAPKQSELRPVGLMSMETFHKVMDWVRYFVEKGTQKELNLFGIGEPTLNPNLVEMVRIARKNLPYNLPVHTNTNGNTMTDELASQLKDAGITHVDVTGHDALKAAMAIRYLRKYRIFGVLSADFMLTPNNWAGQVDWPTTDYSDFFKTPVPCVYPCPWINRGQVMVMWDGRVTRCCLDASARGLLGTIDNDVANMNVTKFGLCDKCHHFSEVLR